MQWVCERESVPFCGHTGDDPVAVRFRAKKRKSGNNISMPLMIVFDLLLLFMSQLYKQKGRL